jgi:hypothetical protein
MLSHPLCHHTLTRRYRLLLANFLTVGVVHYMFVLFAFCFLGLELEKVFFFFSNLSACLLLLF